MSTYNNLGTNAGADAGNRSGIRDASDTGGLNNSFDGKNAYAKAGFNTYNVTGANVNANAGTSGGNTSVIVDAGGTGSANNNVNIKNAYKKADFSTYNIVSVNTGVSESNTSVTGKEVGNNTNNISVGWSGRIGEANKSRLGRTNKDGVGVIDFEAEVRLERANKGGADRANIEISKKAIAGAVTSTNNSADGGGKVIDWCAGLASCGFALLAAIDCTGNFNLIIPKEIFLDAATSTFNEFLAIFAAFAKTTLEKKPKMYKFNLFIFAANH